MRSMVIDRTPRRVGVYPRCGLLALLLTPTLNARAVVAEETTKLDCGVNALYVLLRLEGRPVTLDRLESVLPKRHPDGYSMAELSAASTALGLDLVGVRFRRGDKPLRRPAIAFLKQAQAGHFSVLRPVGTTGTMVQVIDPPSAPWIADYDQVFAVRPWTGRILIPRDSWTARPVALLLMILAAAGTLAAVIRWLGRPAPAARRVSA